jgi:nucleoside-specific outer membrane channel protein Tsx
LGLNKENDLKFKQYVEFILFPDLKKKYPNNKFLSYLGYRVFDFNDDHNSSINLSKIKTNNMDNPSDLAQFNLAKLDMLEISKNDITKLFYYNLIAYNNQSG